MENNAASQGYTTSLKCAAYIPVYSNGNSVLAVLRDGTSFTIERSMRSHIDNLLKEHNIDMRSLRKNFSDSTGRTNLIPIPLSLDMILIPVRVRKTISPYDGTHAYIVLSQIKQVLSGRYAVIKLNSGYEIKSLESMENVNKKIYQGNRVREKFASVVFGEYNLKEGISAIGLEYTMPATKGDLCLLAYEIMRLRRIFERRGGENSEEKSEKE